MRQRIAVAPEAAHGRHRYAAGDFGGDPRSVWRLRSSFRSSVTSVATIMGVTLDTQLPTLPIESPAFSSNPETWLTECRSCLLPSQCRQARAYPLRRRASRCARATGESRDCVALWSSIHSAANHTFHLGGRQIRRKLGVLPSGIRGTAASKPLRITPKNVRYRRNARMAVPGKARECRCKRDASCCTKVVRSSPRSDDQSGAAVALNLARKRLTQKQ
jgi:hypothetical protein